jgi:TIR domain
MARALRAFVSYRRSDAFMHGPIPGKPNLFFIAQLRRALEQLGFKAVFVDTAEIKAGDYFEGRIYKAISNCDLFISLIGQDWLRIFNEKKGKLDVLEREHAAAFELEKDIVPLLIDGATMPPESELTKEIEMLSYIDAKTVTSNASVEELVEALREPVQELSRVHKLGTGWTASYVGFAFLVWVFCGIVPNAVGFTEFGYDSWTGMATAWSGMFIWPAFFLPFIMLALHRPLQILLEATLNADSFGDALTYASPLWAGIILAAFMTVSEISVPQVPWTIHPVLPLCPGPPDPGPTASREASRQYDQDKQTLGSYSADGALMNAYRDEFWMKNKCWPGVFFYLTVPVRGTQAAGNQPAGPPGEGIQSYAAGRAEVQKAFWRMIAKDSKAFKGTDAPYSTLFPFYALAFFLMIWPLSAAIIMAIIYAAVSIRRPRDGKVLRVPNEDAFLCLTYAFVTLLVWVPFRMTTNSIKFSYYCADVLKGCGPIQETFFKDFGLGLALLIGYSAVTLGMLWNHRRMLLGFVGTLAVCLISGCAVAAALYHQTLSQLTDYWQFWLAVSLLAYLMLIALWYQYDPAIVRFRDLQDSAARRRRR